MTRQAKVKVWATMAQPNKKMNDYEKIYSLLLYQRCVVELHNPG